MLKREVQVHAIRVLEKLQELYGISAILQHCKGPLGELCALRHPARLIPYQPGFFTIDLTEEVKGQAQGAWGGATRWVDTMGGTTDEEVLGGEDNGGK